MKKTSYIPTLEHLEDRVLLHAGPPSTALHPLTEPPISDCVEMRTMGQSHHAMEIVMSPDHCCSSEPVVHIEHGELVVHVPPALAGRIVRIEGGNSAVVVGRDGHAHLPFSEPAGTVTLTMTNYEGENIPFLRVTHDGRGTITHKQCLLDLHKLMEVEEHEHVHEAHEEHFHPHAPHAEHAEHPHAPHGEHMEREEKQENHEPHTPHEEHTESPLEEHDAPGEESHKQAMERQENTREMDDRLLFEEAFQWGSWSHENSLPLVPQQEEFSCFPIVEGTDPPPRKEQQESIAGAPTKELWPIIGGATIAAAALVGAYAFEHCARRKDEEECCKNTCKVE